MKKVCLTGSFLGMLLFHSCSKHGSSVSAPKVTTLAVTNITDSSATGGGNITSNGGSAITGSGLMWDTTTKFSSPHLAENTTGANNFTLSITDLPQGTTWYVRAYAANPGDSGFGSTMTFTTDTVPSDYIVSTYAGNGATDSINGPALTASFLGPTSVVVDPAGNVFVGEGSLIVGHIRHIGTDGNVTGFAATKTAVSDIIMDHTGNLYAVDNSSLLYKITPAGVTSIFAGSGAAATTDGQGTAASFTQPVSIDIDPAGNLYITDRKNIRKVTPAGYVSTLPVTANSFFEGIAVDQSQNIYVADGSQILKIDASNNVTFIAGSKGSADGTGSAAGFADVTELRLDKNGNLIAADPSNRKVRSITLAGVVTTVAGNGQSGSTDGSGSKATFSAPVGLSIDASGNIFVADIGSNKIRMIRHK